MCVIRVRGSINYINILLKSQGRVYKGPKRGRTLLSISLPPMEIYLVAAEQWGPWRCSISWCKHLKLHRANEDSAENGTWFFFFFASFFLNSKLLSSRLFCHQLQFSGYFIHKSKTYLIIAPLHSDCIGTHVPSGFSSTLNPLNISLYKSKTQRKNNIESHNHHFG